MRKNTIASRNCRFASKYCRMAGVAPAGSEDTGGEAISGKRLDVSITLRFCRFCGVRGGSDRVLRGSAGFSLVLQVFAIRDSRVASRGSGFRIYRFDGSTVIVLAVDTTTKSGSIAVVDDEVVRVERTGDPEVTYGQRLPAELTNVLEQARVGIEDIDLFAVAAGPGS